MISLEYSEEFKNRLKFAKRFMIGFVIFIAFSVTGFLYVIGHFVSKFW
jgi:hypothetical protein